MKKRTQLRTFELLVSLVAISVYSSISLSQTPCSGKTNLKKPASPLPAKRPTAVIKKPPGLQLLVSWIGQLDNSIEGAWNEKLPRTTRNEKFALSERLVYGIDEELKKFDSMPLTAQERLSVRKATNSMSSRAAYFYPQKSLRWRAQQENSPRMQCPSDRRVFVRTVLYQRLLEIGKTQTEAMALSDKLEGDYKDPFMLAIVWMNQGYYQSTIDQLDKLPANQCTYERHLLKAACFHSLHNEEAEFEQFKEAEVEQPKNAIPHFLRSIAYSSKEDTKAARQEITAAEALEKTEPALLSMAWGHLCFAEGKYQEALRHFSRASQIEPTYADAYQYAGECYSHLNDRQNWLNISRKAVEAESTNPYRHARLAAALESLHRYSEAIVEYDCALDISPRLQRLHEYKGDCHLSSRNWKQAIEEYEKVEQTNGDKGAVAESKQLAKPADSNLSANNGTAPKEQLQIKIFRQTEHSDATREIAIAALELLPNAVIAALKKDGVAVVIAPKASEYVYNHNKDILMQNQLPVEEVSGEFIHATKEAIIGEDALKDFLTRDSKIHLVLHELGHAYDRSLGKVSFKLPFKLYFAKELEAMPLETRRNVPFCHEDGLIGCSQLFAELFSFHYMDPTSKGTICTMVSGLFPRCFNYVKQQCP